MRPPPPPPLPKEKYQSLIAASISHSVNDVTESGHIGKRSSNSVHKRHQQVKLVAYLYIVQVRTPEKVSFSGPVLRNPLALLRSMMSIVCVITVQGSSNPYCLMTVFSAHTFRRGAPPRLSTGPPPPATLWKLRDAFLERPPRLNVGGSEHFFFFFFFLLSEGKFLRCRCWAVDWTTNLREGWRLLSGVFCFHGFWLRFRCKRADRSRPICARTWSRAQGSLPGNRSWALCKCICFLAFWEERE